jgi:hypothetical protein
VWWALRPTPRDTFFGRKESIQRNFPLTDFRAGSSLNFQGNDLNSLHSDTNHFFFLPVLPAGRQVRSEPKIALWGLTSTKLNFLTSHLHNFFLVFSYTSRITLHGLFCLLSNISLMTTFFPMLNYPFAYK